MGEVRITMEMISGKEDFRSRINNFKNFQEKLLKSRLKMITFDEQRKTKKK